MHAELLFAIIVTAINEMKLGKVETLLYADNPSLCIDSKGDEVFFVR
jgi:hypothetical protein